MAAGQFGNLFHSSDQLAFDFFYRAVSSKSEVREFPVLI